MIGVDEEDGRGGDFFGRVVRGVHVLQGLAFVSSFLTLRLL